MITYADAKTYFKLDGLDNWGHTMIWWFTIADEMYFNRPALTVPNSWQYGPSPMGATNEPDAIETEIVEQMSDSDLMAFGLLLDRYCHVLEHAGLSY